MAAHEDEAAALRQQLGALPVDTRARRVGPCQRAAANAVARELHVETEQLDREVPELVAHRRIRRPCRNRALRRLGEGTHLPTAVDLGAEEEPPPGRRRVTREGVEALDGHVQPLQQAARVGAQPRERVDRRLVPLRPVPALLAELLQVLVAERGDRRPAVGVEHPELELKLGRSELVLVLALGRRVEPGPDLVRLLARVHLGQHLVERRQRL